MSAANQAFWLAAEELTPWLAEQAKTRRVLAPAKEGYAVLFRPLAAGSDPLLERTRVSCKAAIMPASETLMRFSATKDAADPGTLHVQMEDLSTQAGAEPTLVFGCRSCDARGFVVLDKPYLEGPYKDPYYAARRASTVLMVQTCNSPCPTCFCHWVGGNPDSTQGADVTFTAVSDGYVLEAHTERGAALLAGLPQARDDKKSEALGLREAARAALAPAPDLCHAPERVAERFADDAFWQDHTAKCLACGACTYMCPTCQCFTIVDEGDLMRGERLRSWDSCMTSQFTLEASGHNPRDRKAERMRQRVSHKYCYSPKNAAGMFSCTGCGRCIRYCPVSLDIREIVVKAVEKA